ncbi:hypothetical protein HNP37_000879 [Flavobacterium nitrogenifigens]|uniref:Chain length determinant protein n=2 Tax=Flavobacterium TaxID=237 RepID=A0A7W7N5J9_9FLAO|nr:MULTISPECIES: hypothetical protein [Flavobacterium]MBB4800840.1 hypothetical protein [Flavobacterium nitrogenifigens]MBB6385412.1 hypothetical protein [Flavobacterium notoginsengisoli]
MSTKVPQNQEDQEIDLVQISKKIGNFFERLNRSIFSSIQFFLRNWIIVLVLIVTGFAIGWYLDTARKSYSNEIIVEPNFESVDYLYSKIDLLQSKVISHDTVFLKNVVGIKRPKLIKRIQIRPIVEAYKFVENKERNFQLLELMAENGDINKILVDTITSKNYRYHTISFTTNEIGNDTDFAVPILNFLNNSEYFNTVQKIELKNLQAHIVQNDSIIKQINNVLSNFSNVAKGAQNDKLVYYNENTQLNDLIKTKQYLIDDQGKNRLKLISYEKTIKEISSTINVESKKSINSKLKFYLPLLFILFFVLLNSFKAFYKKQLLLEEKEKNN